MCCISPFVRFILLSFVLLLLILWGQQMHAHTHCTQVRWKEIKLAGKFFLVDVAVSLLLLLLMQLVVIVVAVAVVIAVSSFFPKYRAPSMWEELPEFRVSIDWIPLQMNTPWPFKWTKQFFGHRRSRLNQFNQKRSSSKPIQLDVCSNSNSISFPSFLFLLNCQSVYLSLLRWKVL